MLWLQLCFCLGLIVVAGYFLSRSADQIAEQTGLSASWLGLLLLSTATSLPELATGLSAVTLVNSPDIAVGDVLGSAIFNLTLLVLLELVYRPKHLYRDASAGHVLTASLGASLLALAAVLLWLDQAGLLPRWGHVGIYSPLLILAYLWVMTLIYRAESRDKSLDTPSRSASSKSILTYLLAASVVVAAGCWLPMLAADLADQMGWSHSFVGVQLVAAVTSAPELVVSLAALYIGAREMAIANLLGSNLFNVAILALDDAFYTQDSLLAAASSQHLVTALTAVLMSIVVILALRFRLIRTRIGVSLPALFLLLLYFVHGWWLF